jgi:hypothetical protein
MGKCSQLLLPQQLFATRSLALSTTTKISPHLLVSSAKRGKDREATLTRIQQGAPHSFQHAVHSNPTPRSSGRQSRHPSCEYLTKQHHAPEHTADSSPGHDSTSPIRRSVPPRLADRQIGLQQYRSTRRKNHRKRNPLPLLQPAPRREHCSRRQLLHLLRHRQQHALVFQRHQPVRAKWRLPPARNLSQRLHSRC